MAGKLGCQENQDDLTTRWWITRCINTLNLDWIENKSWIKQVGWSWTNNTVSEIKSPTPVISGGLWPSCCSEPTETCKVTSWRPNTQEPPVSELSLCESFRLSDGYQMLIDAGTRGLRVDEASGAFRSTRRLSHWGQLGSVYHATVEPRPIR